MAFPEYFGLVVVLLLALTTAFAWMPILVVVYALYRRRYSIRGLLAFSAIEAGLIELHLLIGW
jgi:hypothetical protein